MDTRFAHGFNLPEDEITASDYAVVIDTLRAATTTTVCLDQGAKFVAPIQSPEERSDFSSSSTTIGERNGQKIEGFDFTNSPTILENHPDYIREKVIVLLTSNGSRVVRNVQEHTDRILFGCWINKNAIADWLRSRAPDRVWLIPCGRSGQNTFEDRVTAGALWDLLHGCSGDHELDFSEIFQNTESGLHLRDLGFSDDVAFCGSRNELNLAPMLDQNGFVPA